MHATQPNPLAAGALAPKRRHALAPVVALLLLLGFGFGVWHVAVEVLLVAATAVAGTVAWTLGLSWREIQHGMVESMAKGLPAMLTIVVVGALIASWMACGSIPWIIDAGLGLISAKCFLVTACLLACLVSVLTGTSYGTVGTVGVACMGIAHGLGLPAGPAAGAVVAGAYFGDKVSPFSATANLAAAAAQTDVYDAIRAMMRTTLPALAVGLAVYAVLGWRTSLRPDASLDGATVMRAALAAHYRFTWWLLLPPGLMLILAVRRFPIIPSLLLSSGVAVILARAVQGEPFSRSLDALATGYVAQTGNAGIDRLLSQGGFAAMMRPTLIALCSFGFSGVMQRAGLLAVLLDDLLKFARTPARLVATAIGSCIAVAMTTGNSFLSILIPGELLLPAFRRLEVPAEKLASLTADGGTVVVPLIPWSIAGAFVSGTLGVPVTRYAPWAVFCYAGFVLALAYSFARSAAAKPPVRRA